MSDNTAESSGAEKPDPSEVEPLTQDEAVFQRDEDGNLLPRERVIETSKGWRTIKLYPTPKGQAMRYQEEFGDRDDLDIDELDDVLDEKLAEPEIDDWDDVDPGVYLPIMNAVMEDIIGSVPDNEFHAEVRQELEERNDDEGN